MNTFEIAITFYTGEIFEGESEGKDHVEALIAFLSMYQDELSEKNIKYITMRRLL